MGLNALAAAGGSRREEHGDALNDEGAAQVRAEPVGIEVDVDVEEGHPLRQRKVEDEVQEEELAELDEGAFDRHRDTAAPTDDDDPSIDAPMRPSTPAGTGPRGGGRPEAPAAPALPVAHPVPEEELRAPAVADPVRWNRPRNLWILAAALLVVAVALSVGLSVGLAGGEPPVAPPDQEQSYSVSGDALSSFRAGLPPAFLEAMDSPGTPQSRAYGWLRAHPPLPARNESHLRLRLTQRFALASFFFSHGGGGGDSEGNGTWVETDGWLNYSRSECEWYGCSCEDEYGNVAPYIQSIDLSRNGLTGRLSSPAFELALLRDGLRVLFISENSIEGPMPKEIGLLTGIAYLSVGFNLLSGTIPAELGNIHSIVSLSASRNLLSGTLPTELGRLSSLQSMLLLHGNRLTGTIPTEMALLTDLEFLSLHSNLLNGSVPEAVCSRLGYLLGGIYIHRLNLTIDCGYVGCDCGCSCGDTDGTRIFPGSLKS
jgi:hypothetical protein